MSVAVPTVSSVHRTKGAHCSSCTLPLVHTGPRAHFPFLHTSFCAHFSCAHFLLCTLLPCTLPLVHTTLGAHSFLFYQKPGVEDQHKAEVQSKLTQWKHWSLSWCQFPFLKSHREKVRLTVDYWVKLGACLGWLCLPELHLLLWSNTEMEIKWLQWFQV